MAETVSFPSTTPTFEIPLLFTGQAQKEFSINQGFTFVVKSLAKGLNNTIVMFLFLHIDYLIASPLIFQCLANLHWSTKPGLTWRPDTYSNGTLY